MKVWVVYYDNGYNCVAIRKVVNTKEKADEEKGGDVWVDYGEFEVE